MGSLIHDYKVFEDDFLEDLSGYSFFNCTFDGISFDDIKLSNCEFMNCSFKGSSFNGTIFNNCAILNSKFRFSRFFSTEFNECKTTGSQFADSDLSLISINGGIWTLTDLRRQNFSNKEFFKVDFSGADLSYCNFKKAKLTDCNLSESRTVDTDFREAELMGCQMFRCDFKAMKLKKTKMDLAQIVLFAQAHDIIYEP